VSRSPRWTVAATAAARTAADRADLWLPGALGAIGYLAWLPLLVTVAVPPRASDLAFLGADLFSSGFFPLNVLLIATLATLVVLAGCLLAAFAEAALLRAAGHGTPGRSLTGEVEAILSVMLVAALPALAAAAALSSAVAAVAPAEFVAPDSGIPLVWRLAGRVVPLLAGLGVLAVLGQAFGAVAIRRAVGPAAAPVGVAMRAAVRDLAQHPVRRIGIALASFVADLVALALAIALLRVLWAPIRADLGAGQLVSPPALLLLLGFVAIWLALVFCFGALHAWISTWWSLELARPPAEGRPAAQEAHP
jgi:hypothetical protein